jgi:hypothetical protein
MWAALAISATWLAVLFAAVSNGAGTQSTTIPSAILVAFFAWLATASIAKHGLHDDKR